MKKVGAGRAEFPNAKARTLSQSSMGRRRGRAGRQGRRAIGGGGTRSEISTWTMSIAAWCSDIGCNWKLSSYLLSIQLRVVYLWRWVSEFPATLWFKTAIL